MGERIDQLIDAWHDGGLDPAQRQELADLLAASPSARHAWWSAVQLSASLREHLHEMAGKRSGIRLRARPRSRRPRGLWILATAAALLLLAAGLIWRTAPERSHLPVLSLGEAVDERGVRIALGAPLSGRWLTGTGATVRWADGSILELTAGSQIEAPSPGMPVRLVRGEAAATVEPHPAQSPFRLAAAQTVITVLGTRFTLRSGDAGCHLRVDSGRVQWSVAGRDEIIAAGEEREVARDGSASVRVLVVAGAGSAVPAGAWSNLQAAFNAAQPGDRIRLLAGVHRDGGDDQALAVLRLRSPPSRPLRLEADPGAVIEVSGWNGVVLEAAENVELRGLDVRGVGDLGGNGVSLRKSRDIVVVGCALRGLGGSGLNVTGGTRVRVEDCVITACGAHSHHGQGGIDVQELEPPDSSGSPAMVLRRNQISACRAGPENLHAQGQVVGGHAIAIRLRWTPFTRVEPALVVQDNRLVGNDGCGLILADGHTAHVLGNRLADNLRRPIVDTGDLSLSHCSAATIADNRISTRTNGLAVTIAQPDAPAAPTQCSGNIVSGGAAIDLPEGFRWEAGGASPP